MGATARDPNLFPSQGPALQPLKPPLAVNEAGSIEDSKSVVHNFSIVIGGPVYDFLVRLALVKVGLPNVFRRIAALVAITWLPLLFLSLINGTAFGHTVRIPLLYDLSTYTRLLLALPLFMLAEAVIDPAIRRAVEEFVDARIVPETQLPEFEKLLHQIRRLRDSWIPELVLLALAFFPMFLFQHEWTVGTVSSWHTEGRGLTTGGWWYATISAPVFRFILYRWMFRYFIWGLLLWRTSRLDLRLMPTHPDRAAGLEFLSLTQAKFGILFCSLSCVFVGPIANSIVHEGTPLSSYRSLIVAFLATSLIIGLLPLTLLAPKLMRTRHAGLLEFGRLGNQYTEAFDRKWMHPKEPPSEPLLGTGDIQSLADLGNSYAIVQDMRIAPITKRLVIQLTAQAGVPLVPIIVHSTPMGELVKVIVKMVA
jgi:hypothetical protein